MSSLPDASDVVFTTVDDERFAGRKILIGTVPGGAKFYASFVGRQEKAEAYIREAVNMASAKQQGMCTTCGRVEEDYSQCAAGSFCPHRAKQGKK